MQFSRCAIVKHLCLPIEEQYQFKLSQSKLSQYILTYTCHVRYLMAPILGNALRETPPDHASIPPSITAALLSTEFLGR